MAYCSKCGTQLSDGDKFCPKCGNQCGDNSCNATEESSSKSRKPLYITLAVLVVLALIGGGWYFWNNQSKNYSLEGLAKACVRYDWVSDFHEGLARVGKADKFGYIDRNGEEVIPCVFDVSEEEGEWNFHDGLALVYKDGKYFFINKKGEEAFPFNWKYARHFSDGLAAVNNEDEHGYIDTKGKTVFKFSDSEYSWGYNFSDGLAAVLKDGKYGYVDKKGNLVVPVIYELEEMEEPSEFHEGLAAVMKGGKYGYIDKNGKEVIPLKYSGADDFSEGLAAVWKDDLCGFIDNTGNEVVPFNYVWASEFHDGLAVVSKEGKYGYIDKTGKEIIPCQYDFAYDFSEGLAKVSKADKFGYVGKDGKEIIPNVFSGAFDFSEGIAVVHKDDLCGYVDLKGNSTFDVKDKEVEQFVAQKKKEREEREKKEEEERRRIEEENKPSNRFYSFIENGYYVWEASVPHGAVKGNIDALYFEPVNKAAGKVSLVCFSSDFTSFSLKWSGNGNYTISDNAIQFTVKNPLVNISEADNDEWSETYMMIIENEGDGVRLVSEKTNQIFTQKTKHIDNPMTKYK